MYQEIASAIRLRVKKLLLKVIVPYCLSRGEGVKACGKRREFLCYNGFSGCKTVHVCSILH